MSTSISLFIQIIAKYYSQREERKNRIYTPFSKVIKILECGPMPNVIAALRNIGGALCSTLQSLAHAHYQSAVR